MPGSHDAGGGSSDSSDSARVRILVFFFRIAMMRSTMYS